jgi:hypothetical protein
MKSQSQQTLFYAKASDTVFNIKVWPFNQDAVLQDPDATSLFDDE